MRRTLITCFVLLALVAFRAEAKLAAFEFRRMIEEADTIVIGTVESVAAPKGKPSRKHVKPKETPDADFGPPTTAHVKVTEVLKGAQADYVDVYVNKTWVCDISEAKKGEKILLFTDRDATTGHSLIYASGRGRMPIDTVEGKEYATFWPEVRMPKSVKTTEGPEPRFVLLIRRADLNDLKAYIRQVLKEAGDKDKKDDRK